MHFDVSMFITQASPACVCSSSLAVARRRGQSVLTPVLLWDQVAAGVWPWGRGARPPARIWPRKDLVPAVLRAQPPHVRDVHPPAGKLRPHERERVPGVWTRSGAHPSSMVQESSVLLVWLHQNCCFLIKQINLCFLGVCGGVPAVDSVV